MSQMLVHRRFSPERTSDRPVTWASSDAGLWVASRPDADGVRFLGFVERSLGDFLAVDDAGNPLGRHHSLQAAQRAVLVAHGQPVHDAEHWSGAAARLHTAQTLRARGTTPRAA